MLKPYYLKVQAAKISKKNYQELKKLDIGEGVLEEEFGGNFSDVEGDWFVKMIDGYTVIPGYVTLIPVREKRTDKVKKEVKEVKELIKKLNLNCSVEQFQDKVNWEYMSRCQTLSEDFIREFQDKVCWEYISRHQILSEDFIREFQDKIDWDAISLNQKLSENFIREFQDKVEWQSISVHQRLSENFIKEFQDKIIWQAISYFQILSEDFIKEFKEKLDLKYLLKKHKISQSFYDFLFDEKVTRFELMDI